MRVFRIILKIIGRAFIFSFLTLITQVGGVIYLLCLPFYYWFKKKIDRRWQYLVAKSLFFISVYLLFTFVIIPLVARPLGRVPLPVSGEKLRPVTVFTCLLNRNYVTPKMKTTIELVADKMAEDYPGTVTLYMEANFPFINGYRLFPHLSHNEGRKLDVAFFYKDANGRPLTGSPSPTGYGVCVDPLPGETNQPHDCARQGYWQYNAMSHIIPQGKKKDFIFDEERTKALVELFQKNEAVERIFIEPHLKQRLKLDKSKLGVHGCYTVRHDDHVHISIK